MKHKHWVLIRVFMIFPILSFGKILIISYYYLPWTIGDTHRILESKGLLVTYLGLMPTLVTYLVLPVLGFCLSLWILIKPGWKALIALAFSSGFYFMLDYFNPGKVYEREVETIHEAKKNVFFACSKQMWFQLETDNTLWLTKESGEDRNDTYMGQIDEGNLILKKVPGGYNPLLANYYKKETLYPLLSKCKNGHGKALSEMVRSIQESHEDSANL